MLSANLENGIQMLERRVNTAVRKEAHAVDCILRRSDSARRFDEHAVLVKVTVGNRLVDAWDLLIDDAAGTEIRVTYFGIPHLAIR